MSESEDRAATQDKDEVNKVKPEATATVPELKDSKTMSVEESEVNPNKPLGPEQAEGNATAPLTAVPTPDGVEPPPEEVKASKGKTVILREYEDTKVQSPDR